MGRLKKRLSKRQTLRTKYKIQKKVKEHHRKMKKLAKKNPHKEWKSNAEDNHIPNSFPLKEQILREMEVRKQIEDAEKKAEKEAKKKQREKKKNLPKEEISESSSSADLDRVLQQARLQASLSTEAKQQHSFKLINEAVEQADIILEVLDARDPWGSRCFALEDTINSEKRKKREIAEKGKKSSSKDTPREDKPIILVLNKVDLVPQEVAEFWLEKLSQDYPTIAFRSITDSSSADASSSASGSLAFSTLQKHTTLASAEALMQLIQSYQPSSSISSPSSSAPAKSLSVAVVGYANTGKSAFLNTLLKTSATSSSANPNHTKNIVRLRLSKQLTFLDTPSIPATEDTKGPHTILPLTNPIQSVSLLISSLDMEELLLAYSFPAFDSLDEFLDLLATKYGCFVKGGQPNRLLAARSFLKDWNSGKIKYYTMNMEIEDDDEEEENEDEESKGAEQKSSNPKSKPSTSEMKDEDDSSSANVLSQLFQESNTKTLQQIDLEKKQAATSASIMPQLAAPKHKHRRPETKTSKPNQTDSTFLIVRKSVWLEVPDDDEEGMEDGEEMEEIEEGDEDAEDEEVPQLVSIQEDENEEGMEEGEDEEDMEESEEEQVEVKPAARKQDLSKSAQQKQTKQSKTAPASNQSQKSSRKR